MGVEGFTKGKEATKDDKGKDQCRPEPPTCTPFLVKFVTKGGLCAEWSGGLEKLVFASRLWGWVVRKQHVMCRWVRYLVLGPGGGGVRWWHAVQFTTRTPWDWFVFKRIGFGVVLCDGMVERWLREHAGAVRARYVQWCGWLRSKT